MITRMIAKGASCMTISLGSQSLPAAWAKADEMKFIRTGCSKAAADGACARCKSRRTIAGGVLKAMARRCRLRRSALPRSRLCGPWRRALWRLRARACRRAASERIMTERFPKTVAHADPGPISRLPKTPRRPASGSPLRSSGSPRRRSPHRSRRRRRLRLAGGSGTLDAGRQGQPGRAWRCCAGSTGRATRSPKIPSASPAACPPTMPCSGARAAWASPRSSRRCMPRSTAGWRRRRPAPLKLVEIHREDIDSLPALMALVRERPLSFHRLLRRPFLRRRGHDL